MNPKNFIRGLINRISGRSRATDLPDISTSLRADGFVRQVDEYTYDVVVEILGYREDGEWVALAIDMDLRGFGDTFQEAVKDLMDHVRMQVSFAIQQDDMDLVSHPADQYYINIYNQVKKEALRSLAGKSDTDPKYRITGVSLRKDDISEGCYSPA